MLKVAAALLLRTPFASTAISTGQVADQLVAAGCLTHEPGPAKAMGHQGFEEYGGKTLSVLSVR